MKVVAYVPIKLNNERLPNKNLKRFDDGTPMCNLVFNTLSQVEEIDEIYCYCSSPKIKDYLTGRVQFLQRSESLDTPQTRRGDIIEAFLNDIDTDILILSHVTSSFLRVDNVKKCVNAVKSGDYDSAFASSRVQEYLWENGQPLNFVPSNIVRTQELPLIYSETSVCFTFTKKLFEETGRNVGNAPFICEVSKIESIDVDYPQDFEIANVIYMYLLQKSGGGGGANPSHLFNCDIHCVAELNAREAA